LTHNLVINVLILTLYYTLALLTPSTVSYHSDSWVFCLLSYSLIHSHTHSLTHSFILSFIHYYL